MPPAALRCAGQAGRTGLGPLLRCASPADPLSGGAVAVLDGAEAVVAGRPVGGQPEAQLGVGLAQLALDPAAVAGEAALDPVPGDADAALAVGLVERPREGMPDAAAHASTPSHSSRRSCRQRTMASW